MAGQAWGPEDWEWRPTWLPPTAAQLQDSSDSRPDSAVELLASLANAAAGLDAPRRALEVLHDAQLMAFYQAAMQGAFTSAQPPGPNVLVVGRCSTVLGMLAAAGGARGTVACVESSQVGYRLGTELLAANPQLSGSSSSPPGDGCGGARPQVRVVPCPLSAVAADGMLQHQHDAAAGGQGGEDAGCRLAPAGVVVLDLWDARSGAGRTQQAARKGGRTGTGLAAQPLALPALLQFSLLLLCSNHNTGARPAAATCAVMRV